MDLLNRVLGDPSIFVLSFHMIEYHYACALPIAVEFNATDLMSFVPALEQLQCEEPPILPGKFSEFREVIKPSIIKSEWPWLQLGPLIANSPTEVQHPFLYCVDS